MVVDSQLNTEDTNEPENRVRAGVRHGRLTFYIQHDRRTSSSTGRSIVTDLEDEYSSREKSGWVGE
jgi:hypothetical protein